MYGWMHMDTNINMCFRFRRLFKSRHSIGKENDRHTAQGLQREQ